jgi:hypothetical protein
VPPPAVQRAPVTASPSILSPSPELGGGGTSPGRGMRRSRNRRRAVEGPWGSWSAAGGRGAGDGGRACCVPSPSVSSGGGARLGALATAANLLPPLLATSAAAPPRSRCGWRPLDAAPAEAVGLRRAASEAAGTVVGRETVARDGSSCSPQGVAAATECVGESARGVGSVRSAARVLAGRRSAEDAPSAPTVAAAAPRPPPKALPLLPGRGDGLWRLPLAALRPALPAVPCDRGRRRPEPAVSRRR